jgi:uncharacterized protein RhaS with RHS repeats
VETGYDYYGFRFYDTEINRFVSVDPLADKFPALTPYQYASNNPILNVDLDGLEGLPAQMVNNVYTTARATTWLPSQNPALVNTPRLSDRSGNGVMLTSEAGQGQGSRAPKGNVQMVNIDGLLGAFQGAKAGFDKNFNLLKTNTAGFVKGLAEMFNFMADAVGMAKDIKEGVREIKESNDGFVKSKTDTTKEFKKENDEYIVRDRESHDTINRFMLNPDQTKVLTDPN